MRKTLSTPGALAVMLVAVMSVALLGASTAQAAPRRNAAATVAALSSQLPAGVTLSSASIEEIAAALGAAVSAHPESAESLTEVAVLAKMPKKGQGTLSCRSLVKIVSAGVNAAPEKSNDIVQMAVSMRPQCADEINALLVTPPNSNAPNGFNSPSDEYGGFGVGFGPGFPGSPGFTGSPPSGAIALPPGEVTGTGNI